MDGNAVIYCPVTWRLWIADTLVNKLKEVDIPCLKSLGVEVMPRDGSFF